jgi:hypothetical protein
MARVLALVLKHTCCYLIYIHHLLPTPCEFSLLLCCDTSYELSTSIMAEVDIFSKKYTLHKRGGRLFISIIILTLDPPFHLLN